MHKSFDVSKWFVIGGEVVEAKDGEEKWRMWAYLWWYPLSNG